VLALVAIFGATSTRPAVGTRIGDPQVLRVAYERWKVEYSRHGGEQRLVMPLGYNRGLSARFVEAQGQITLDLADGTVDVRVAGLPNGEAFDVWLVHNRPGPGRTVRPEHESGARTGAAGDAGGTSDAPSTPARRCSVLSGRP